MFFYLFNCIHSNLFLCLQWKCKHPYKSSKKKLEIGEYTPTHDVAAFQPLLFVFFNAEKNEIVKAQPQFCAIIAGIILVYLNINYIRKIFTEEIINNK